MAKDTFRAGSRKDWTSPNDDGSLNREQIGVGCLQRIADAAERIANNWQALTNERDRLERENRMLRRQVGAAKGRITKLLNKADAPT